jgi:hypothetical protein
VEAPHPSQTPTGHVLFRYLILFLFSISFLFLHGLALETVEI